MSGRSAPWRRTPGSRQTPSLPAPESGLPGFAAVRNGRLLVRSYPLAGTVAVAVPPAGTVTVAVLMNAGGRQWPVTRCPGVGPPIVKDPSEVTARDLGAWEPSMPLGTRFDL